MSDGGPAIRFRNVHKAFDRPVLAGVNLDILRGEMFAIFGPSGTGKSVLLKTTMGLVVPDRGDVEVAGRSVYFGGERSLAEARSRIGYVFQNAALFDSMNVCDNIGMGIPESRLQSLSKAERARAVWEALELVNLEPREVLGMLPAQLSGGMKKRAGIARTIVGRPHFLLWDEPTTGLDPVNTAAVERLIARLSENLKTTSVIVTHDVSGALWMCDRVAMLEGGKIRFCGSPDEFRSSKDPVVRAFVDRGAAQAALDIVEMT